MIETATFNAYESAMDGLLRAPVLKRLIRTARRGTLNTAFARCVSGLDAGCEDSGIAESRLREQILCEYHSWRRRQTQSAPRRRATGAHSESFHTV